MLGARHTRRTLNTKLRRDLRHQTTAFGAVGVTVLLGVALFGAAYDAYLNLQGSYDEVFDQLAIADIWVTGGDTAAIADKVALVDGVARVATRTQVDQPLRVDGDKLAGRLVGLPEPRLNDVAVQAGALPEPGGGVLAEQHLASAFDLGVGDQVEVLVGDTWQPLRLSGSAASGEYLWLAASKQELISLPTEFGVAFAPQATVAEITGRAPNQVLVRTAEDIDRLEAAHEVRAIAREHGAADVYTWEDQPSNAALQEDISGFSQMALLFPLLFLTAAAMASYTLLSRRIHQERAVIGMLRAQGVARREVLRHYLGYGLVAGLCGAIPGVVLGLWLARSLTRFYVGFLELPVTAVAFHPVTPVVGLTFGAVTGAVAAWAPARTAAAISPAAAMQGVAPATGGRRSLLERLVPFASSLPASWRLVLRSIGRNRRRSVMTAGGVTLALLLILVSWSLLDTVQGNLDRQFSQRDTSDAYVEFTAPTSDDPALADLRAVEGVTTAEAVTRAPVTITGPDGSYATALEALPAGTTLREFEVVDGDPDGLAAEGLLVGTAMRDLVGIEVGDTVTLTVRDPRSNGDLARVQTSIAGFVRETLGTSAYTSRADLAATVGAPVPATGALLAYEDDVAPDVMRDRIEGLTDVAAYRSSDAVRELIEDVTGLLVGFITIMLVCGGALAATMIFTTVSVSIAERTNEVATLRASGVSVRTVARLVTTENLVVALLGIVPGLVLGVLGGRLMMATYTTDQFSFDFIVSPLSLAASVGAILLVAVASQLPGLRSLARLDLARTVRERAA